MKIPVATSAVRAARLALTAAVRLSAVIFLGQGTASGSTCEHGGWLAVARVGSNMRFVQRVYSQGSQIRRAGLIAAIVAIVMMAMLVVSASASADEDRSFQGCPKLGEGTSGLCVTRLQGELDDALPAYNLEPDGRFGPGTRIAVLDFQGRNHLGADGIVGSITADLLDQQAGPQSVLNRASSMCNEQGLSYDENGRRCGGPLDQGAAVDTGKSAWECFQEVMGKDLIKEVQKNLDEEGARKAGEFIPKSALRKALSKAAAPAEAFKCINFG